MDRKWNVASEQVLRMLSNRGYELHCKESFVVIHSQTQEKIQIFLDQNDKLNIEKIKIIVSILNQSDIKHAIIIYRSITASVRKLLKNFYQLTVELFPLTEMQYDLTEFQYYCLHVRCDSEERKQVLQKFKMEELPLILSTDAVCRYFFFQRGELIRIQRKNGTLYYRIVN